LHSIFDLSPLVQALSTLEHVANALREEEALKRRCRSLEEELRASQSRVFDLTNSEEELKQRYAALEEELKKGQDEHEKCQNKLQEELKTSQSQVLTHKMSTDQSKIVAMLSFFGKNVWLLNSFSSVLNLSGHKAQQSLQRHAGSLGTSASRRSNSAGQGRRRACGEYSGGQHERCGY